MEEEELAGDLHARRDVAETRRGKPVEPRQRPREHRPRQRHQQQQQSAVDGQTRQQPVRVRRRGLREQRRQQVRPRLVRTHLFFILFRGKTTRDGARATF